MIIRDNSGNATKRAMLEQFRREHCTIVFAEPCDAVTNFAEVLKLAQGDFVFFMADDDFGFDRAVAMLPGLIDQVGGDKNVAALTGAYMLDASKGSSIVAYQNVDADDAATRVAGYLAFEAANVLAYSPIRRSLVERVHAFMNSMPVSFSFHDQIMCLLYLLNGKFVPIKRLMYFYDVGEWEKPETAQKRDLSFYTASKADPALNKLHWFLSGFEGAALIRNSDMFPDMPMAARQPIADRWFSAMFVRFMKNPRTNFGSPLAARGRCLLREVESIGRPPVVSGHARRHLQFHRAVFQGRRGEILCVLESDSRTGRNPAHRRHKALLHDLRCHRRHGQVEGVAPLRTLSAFRTAFSRRPGMTASGALTPE